MGPVLLPPVHHAPSVHLDSRSGSRRLVCRPSEEGLVERPLIRVRVLVQPLNLPARGTPGKAPFDGSLQRAIRVFRRPDFSPPALLPLANVRLAP
jgi:hypothetical protein